MKKKLLLIFFCFIPTISNTFEPQEEKTSYGDVIERVTCTGAIVCCCLLNKLTSNQPLQESTISSFLLPTIPKRVEKLRTPSDT